MHDRQDRTDTPWVLAPRLRITTTTAPGTAVIVRLDGEADQDDRHELEDTFDRAVRARPPRLIVDLTGLTFCYSVCLNVLLAARLDAKAAGVEMVLAAPPRQTLRLLEITGTAELFTCYAGVRAALAAPLPAGTSGG
ncbi:STAS domain-containing protein [Kitasatospora sp. RB6PN24]|uniref:STAS domain-containing protein n=1 Tax=Kitasatospora humi TaxID=2893891 RepID=UPI001E4CD85C|nr:STAS domain-containing protein [Kitasatospora humi]MCC9310555.1 STAS domain-containing protein [Kitasatospora humi]